MKIWSRDFTRFEKGLLLVLALILVGLAYYFVVDRPVRSSIAQAEAEYEAMEAELAAVNAKIARLEKLAKETESMKEDGSISYMASYNNSKEELALLNDILSDTVQYNVTFTNVTRNNNQIRRNFSLQFRTEDYASMWEVINGLCESDYRCLVGDIRCQAAKDRDSRQYVTADVTATFFETMVGGTPDAGLPEDKGSIR